MSLLPNATDGNSSLTTRGYFSILRVRLKQCYQQIFTDCLCNCKNSSSTEIPLSEIGFSRLEENSVSKKVVFNLRYSQKNLTASEKLKKQLLFALNGSNHKSKLRESPFVFPDLIQKTEPATHVSFGSAIAQRRGSREEQEDGFLKQSKVKFRWQGEEVEAFLFSVFDGHKDRGNVSHHLNQQLIPSLENLLARAQDEYEELGDEVIANAFTQVFDNLSKSYRKKCWSRGGAVITCVFVIGNAIYIPNVGDSRTILIKPDCTLPLTEDGIVENRRFQKWYLDRGYTIFKDPWGVYRIRLSGGNPMFARDIGRLSMCTRPKITKVTIGDGIDNLDEGIIFCKKGDFLLLASDGLYEVATTAEIGEAVRNFVQMGFSLEEIATQIASKAGSLPDSDNITVQIVAI